MAMAVWIVIGGETRSYTELLNDAVSEASARLVLTAQEVNCLISPYPLLRSAASGVVVWCGVVWRWEPRLW